MNGSVFARCTNCKHDLEGRELQYPLSLIHIFNNVYMPRLEEAGMVISARTPTENLPEMMELPDHPWFVGVQFLSLIHI